MHRSVQLTRIGRTGQRICSNRDSNRPRPRLEPEPTLATRSRDKPPTVRRTTRDMEPKLHGVRCLRLRAFRVRQQQVEALSRWRSRSTLVCHWLHRRACMRPSRCFLHRQKQHLLHRQHRVRTPECSGELERFPPDLRVARAWSSRHTRSRWHHRV